MIDRVRLLVPHRVGSAACAPLAPAGSEHDMPAPRAARLIARGVAERVDPAPAPCRAGLPETPDQEGPA